ncbi:MAG: hypothetical protein NVS2B6_04170 [Thermoleophilaceae bacterium]
MIQMLRVAAIWTSGIAWLALGLVVLPAMDGGSGHSPRLQTLVAAAFIVGLAWAAAAMAYDRARRRVLAPPTR